MNRIIIRIWKIGNKGYQVINIIDSKKKLLI